MDDTLAKLSAVNEADALLDSKLEDQEEPLDDARILPVRSCRQTALGHINDVVVLRSHK